MSQSLEGLKPGAKYRSVQQTGAAGLNILGCGRCSLDNAIGEPKLNIVKPLLAIVACCVLTGCAGTADTATTYIDKLDPKDTKVLPNRIAVCEFEEDLEYLSPNHPTKGCIDGSGLRYTVFNKGPSATKLTIIGRNGVSYRGWVRTRDLPL